MKILEVINVEKLDQLDEGLRQTKLREVAIQALKNEDFGEFLEEFAQLYGSAVEIYGWPELAKELATIVKSGSTVKVYTTEPPKREKLDIQAIEDRFAKQGYKLIHHEDNNSSQEFIFAKP